MIWKIQNMLHQPLIFYLNLKEIFEELRLFFDRRIQIRRQITTISAYPIFVVLIAISVLTFMLKSVVPMFGKVFKQFGKELPSLTKKIIFVEIIQPKNVAK